MLLRTRNQLRARAEPYHEPLIPIPDVFDDDYDPLRDDVYYDDYLHVISSPIKARLEDHLLPEELFDEP